MIQATDDIVGHAPAHRRYASRGADADDAPRDRVCRRYRDAEFGRREQRNGAAGLGAKPLERREPRDPRSHRVNDAPAADQRAQTHRGVARQHHPVRHVKLAAEIALRVEQHRDDAHRLLRIVAAVAERVERCRHQLQRAEDFVDRIRRIAAEQPRDEQEQQHREDESAQGRQHDRRAGLAEAGPHDRRDPHLGHAGADQPPDQRMRAR